MQASTSLKKAILKNMLVGLQQSGIATRNMNIMERKGAIKVTADIALAFTNYGTNWSQAITEELPKQEKNKTMIRSILGEKVDQLRRSTLKWKVHRSNKILRRAFLAQARAKKNGCAFGYSACVLAKAMVKKRTRVLKRLVPGGKCLNGFTLLDETIDYIIALQAQVDVMELLIKALPVQKTNYPCIEGDEIRNSYFKR